MHPSFLLHCSLDGGDEDIARHHAVLRGEAVGKILAVNQRVFYRYIQAISVRRRADAPRVRIYSRMTA